MRLYKILAWHLYFVDLPCCWRKCDPFYTCVQGIPKSCS